MRKKDKKNKNDAYENEMKLKCNFQLKILFIFLPFFLPSFNNVTKDKK